MAVINIVIDGFARAIVGENLQFAPQNTFEGIVSCSSMFWLKLKLPQ